jgi:signal transduction histidine kinase
LGLGDFFEPGPLVPAKHRPLSTATNAVDLLKYRKSMNRETTGLKDWRLQRFYYVNQIAGMVILIGLWLWDYNWPELFTFFGDPDVSLFLISVIFILNTFYFFCREVFKKKFFFILSRYSWVLFWLAVIYNSGGVNTKFVFLLIFPLLVAAADLESESTKRVGITVTVGFCLMILLEPAARLTPAIWAEHLTRTGLLAVLSYFAYYLVKETLRQKYERELAERRFIEFVEFDKIKGDFLTVAEHQLRTPLSGARWGIDNLINVENASELDRRKILITVAGKIEDAIKIVNEMLKTAELDIKGMKIHKEPVIIGGLVERVLKELEFLAAKNSVRVIYKKPAEQKILGDPRLLKSALINIVDNAMRYSPNGTVEVKIEPRNKEVKLTVRDTGIGIGAEDLPYIFERFYRSREAISMQPNESGVGLYVTKKVVELHGGSIKINSKKSVGTIIEITLPAN